MVESRDPKLFWIRIWKLHDGVTASTLINAKCCHFETNHGDFAANYSNFLLSTFIKRNNVIEFYTHVFKDLSSTLTLKISLLRVCLICANSENGRHESRGVCD